MISGLPSPQYNSIWWCELLVQFQMLDPPLCAISDDLGFIGLKKAAYAFLCQESRTC